MLPPKFAALVAELQSISPMPDDDALVELPQKEHPLDKLYNIIFVLKQEEYSLELIPPLLQVFGIGEGMEVFQHVVSVIEKYSNMEEAYPLIQEATRSENAGTRKWCCLLLGRRRNKVDEPFLTARLKDDVAQVRQKALVGILMIAQRYDMRHLIPMVEPLLQDEDWEVQTTAIDTLEMLKMSGQGNEDR